MDDEYDELEKWVEEEEALGNMPDVSEKEWKKFKEMMKDLTKRRGGKVSRKRGGTVSRKRGSKIMQGYKAGGKV
jgi:hypothetical protein